MMRPERSSSAVPLLGDSTFPALAKVNTRRLARPLLALVVLGVLSASAAYHSGVPAALEPYTDRLSSLKSWAASKPAPKFRERVEWSEEDQVLRNYTWETPEVHASLRRHVDALTPSRRRVYDWLYDTRVVSQGGTPIGLGASDPPQEIRPGAAAPIHLSEPREGEGPGLFSSGSKNKYNELVQEWKTGMPFTMCDKGTWEEDYAQLHAEMMTGEKEPWILEYVCHEGGWCGGFADRMLGMISTFLYSVVTGRAFALTWEQPTPPDLVFDSPYIDWARPFNKTSSTPTPYPYSNRTIADNKLSLQGHDWPWFWLDDFFPKFNETYGAGKNESWIQLDMNRGVVIRSFYYDNVQPVLEWMGLRATTAYNCLINYLLRPKAAALRFITQYTSLFSMPEYFTVGIQIRTGDWSMFATAQDQNTAQLHRKYFTCASQIAARHAHPSQKVLYYLITDSHKLEESALKLYPNQVVVAGFTPTHDEIAFKDRSGPDVAKGSADGFMRTIAESWIFAGTDYQIITYRSGFGKIPTWLRGRDHTTVQMFNEYLDPALTAGVKAGNGGKLPPPPDCGKQSAFKSIEDLAQDWSLG
ncbi:hypothetical protein JCM11251_007783 [Rhodosporidiobolus azoricus]